MQLLRASYALVPAGDGLFTNLPAARPLPELVAAGTQGAGRIESGAREISVEAKELMLPSPEGFRLWITGEPDTTCRVLATTDFSEWQEVRQFNLGQLGEADFSDTSIESTPRRFFQVVGD